MPKWTREYGWVIDWQDMCDDDHYGGSYKGTGRPACGDCAKAGKTFSDCSDLQRCTVTNGTVLKYNKPCDQFVERPGWQVTLKEHHARLLLEKKQSRSMKRMNFRPNQKDFFDFVDDEDESQVQKT